MMLRIYIYYNVCMLLSVALYSCNGNSGSVENAEPVRIERFDMLAAGFDNMSQAERDSFISEYEPALRLLVPEVLWSKDESDSLISAYAGSPAMTIFESDIQKYFGKSDTLEMQLGQVKSVFDRLYSRSEWPSRIIGIVLPYNQSIVYNDTCALVGLNHYLGMNYEGYRRFEPYQRRFKNKEQLPVRLAESVLLRSYPFKHSDESTVLSRMLYDGAVLWGVKHSLPDTPDSVLMGWSSSQQQWVDDNMAEVWQSLIERKLLFSTDPWVIDRISRTAPATSLISQECPGRIVGYIGMLIVDRFLEKNKQAEPSQMLDSAVYNSSTTLVKSGFAPQLGL